MMVVLCRPNSAVSCVIVLNGSCGIILVPLDLFIRLVRLVGLFNGPPVPKFVNLACRGVPNTSSFIGFMSFIGFLCGALDNIRSRTSRDRTPTGVFNVDGHLEYSSTRDAFL